MRLFGPQTAQVIDGVKVHQARVIKLVLQRYREFWQQYFGYVV